MYNLQVFTLSHCKVFLVRNCIKKNCLKYKHGERTSSVEVTKNRDFGMTGVLYSQVIMYSELPWTMLLLKSHSLFTLKSISINMFSCSLTSVALVLCVSLPRTCSKKFSAIPVSTASLPGIEIYLCCICELYLIMLDILVQDLRAFVEIKNTKIF